MDSFEQELKAGFLEEAAQLLSDTEQCFLTLESNTSDKEVLEKIFRLAHNLKGSAKAVGFGQISEFTHHLESLLLKLKNGTLEIRSETVSLLLKCNDHLRSWVDTLKGNFEASVDSQELLAEIEAQSNGQTSTDNQTIEEDTSHSEEEAPAPIDEEAKLQGDSLLNDASESAKIAQMFEEKIEKTTREQVQTEAGQPSNPTPAPAPAPVTTQAAQPTAATPSQSGASQDESLRVSIKRLEKLLNNVGELVILQTVLNQQRYQIQSTLVQKTIVQLSKITKDIQDISMSLRMVPLKQTFQKMQRIVRDISKALNKEIILELNGEETELDKTVVENLGDPLVHLIRNAVDHGIEDTAERIAAGKPSSGRVKLSAEHRGGQMVIEIKDDGRGLDPQKLRSIAIQKGVLKPTQTISDKEAYHLIFAAGFSTKSAVTDISGRGVGMDVVRTNIEKLLQGEIQLETELGKGTCFRILLPLTLAIIDGMVVRAGEDRYIIPIPHVHESIQPKKEDVHYVSGMGEVLSLRNENMPLYRMNSLLGRTSKEQKDPSECIAIIVRVNSAPFAILVDDILGQQQVVIKQLGNELKHLKGITGGAILGDGKAALILDLPELSTKSTGRDRKTNTQRGVA